MSANTPTTYELQIGNRFVTVRSFAEASQVYSRIRAKSGLGASKLPFGKIWQGNIEVASVSYNGRVWSVGDWAETKKPLLEAV